MEHLFTKLLRTNFNFTVKEVKEVLIKRDNVDSNSSDLEALRENRLKYLKNRLMDYLNISAYLMEIIRDLSLDYPVLSETKIDQSFPTAQFNIEKIK